uniref:ShKT domain-containing protein n=1 Tax=Romanomermis culicivorax TaxID=13658 RepID=A0A915J0E3_ROMCU
MVVCKYGPGLDYNPMPRPFIWGRPCTQCGSLEANEHCKRNHGLCPSKCMHNTECVDRDPHCPAYRSAGCHTNLKHTRKYCKLSCQVDGCGR